MNLDQEQPYEVSPPKHAFASDVFMIAFDFLAIAIFALFTVRLGLALMSSDKIEFCALRSNAKGYTLVQQRRWQVIPMAVDFDRLDEMLKVAQAVCPNLQAK